MDPRVLDAMLPFLTDLYGNPHSRTHAYGWEAEKAVDFARQVSVNLPNCVFVRQLTYVLIPLQQVAAIIGADEKDIVFTSGATESNNMIIKGVARFHKDKKKHIITLQTACSTLML
jgi:cysteine desulfurase